MRISRLLAIGLLALSLAVMAAPASSLAAPPDPTPSTVPVAILGLFEDDENEPDENEADEGGDTGAAQSSDDDESETSSGFSLLQLGLILALVAIAGLWVTRWFFRIRSWIRRPAS